MNEGLPKPLWSEELRVKAYEADHTGSLKLHSLFNELSDVAGNHAAHLGVGYRELLQAGYFWVLSRIKVRIFRMPAMGENVLLETWPKGVERLFALRDFRMTDREGATLVAATSAWLLLDAGRSRPHKIEVLPYRIPLREGVDAIPGLPEKLTPVEGLELKYERKVMPSDLDVNNHVNNAEYVRWIADCAGCDNPGTIASIHVNYLDEALLGDTIELRSGKDEGQFLRVEGVNRSGGRTVFQARIGWRG